MAEPALTERELALLEKVRSRLDEPVEMVAAKSRFSAAQEQAVLRFTFEGFDYDLIRSAVEEATDLDQLAELLAGQLIENSGS